MRKLGWALIGLPPFLVTVLFMLIPGPDGSGDYEALGHYLYLMISIWWCVFLMAIGIVLLDPPSDDGRSGSFGGTALLAVSLAGAWYHLTAYTTFGVGSIDMVWPISGIAASVFLFSGWLRGKLIDATGNGNRDIAWTLYLLSSFHVAMAEALRDNETVLAGPEIVFVMALFIRHWVMPIASIILLIYTRWPSLKMPDHFDLVVLFPANLMPILCIAAGIGAIWAAMPSNSATVEKG